MKSKFTFYLVVDPVFEDAKTIVRSVSSFESQETSVHSEFRTGTWTFQVETTDLFVATEIKLRFGPFIQHESTGDA